MKTIHIELIIKAFFLSLIIVSMGSLIVALLTGLDTSPLN